MQNYIGNGFINLIHILIIFFSVLNISIAGESNSCWCDSTPVDYDGWMNTGKSAKSSKKKICCYSKAITKTNDINKKAEAYFQRGYAKYYYVMDFQGETWTKSSDSTNDGYINESMDEAMKEEAKVPLDERKDDGYKDYKEALRLNANHSDAAFEIGVYYYWKAYRNDAKEKGEKKEKAVEDGTYNKDTFDANWKKSSITKNLYLNSIKYFNLCITNDKICSSAYDLRSRAKKQIEQNTYKNDELIRDYLRTTDDSNPSTTKGLYAFYCDSKNLSSLRKRKIVGPINFNWGEGNIDKSVGNNNVSVRFIGRLEIPEKGSYIFHTISDDGVALYVDEKQIIKNWTDHGSKLDSSSSITFGEDMVGKKVSIVLEWYENGGDAVIKLYWTPPSKSEKEIIPLKYLYLPANPNVTKLPEFWQGGVNIFSPDAAENSDSPNSSYWHLQLDANKYKNLKGDFNDNLSSLTIPDFYVVSLYQHYNYGGKVFAFKGPCTISDLSAYKFKDGNDNKDMNDQTSCISIQTTSGFGQ